MGCVLVEGPSPRGLSKILRTRSHLLRTNQSSRTSGTDRDFSLLHWTDRFYFEVCADPAVCAALPGEKSAAKKA